MTCINKNHYPDPDILCGTLAAVFGTPVSISQKIDPMGSHSRAYHARINGRDVIIKLTVNRNSYPAEIYIYKKLACLGVPVPEVIFYSACLQPFTQPCLIISKIEGFSIIEKPLNIEHMAEIYSHVGNIFAKLHSIPCDYNKFGYGAFLSDTPANFAHWGSFLNEFHACQKSLLFLSKAGLIDRDQAYWLNITIAECLQHDFKPVILHGDLGPDHIFIHNIKIAGIIDPGNAFIGPKEYDLAYFGLYVGPKALRHALDAYHYCIDIPRIWDYLAVIAAHKAVRSHLAGNYHKRDFFLRELSRCGLQRGSRK